MVGIASGEDDIIIVGGHVDQSGTGPADLLAQGLVLYSCYSANWNSASTSPILSAVLSAVVLWRVRSTRNVSPTHIPCTPPHTPCTLPHAHCTPPHAPCTPPHLPHAPLSSHCSCSTSPPKHCTLESAHTPLPLCPSTFLVTPLPLHVPHTP